MNKYHETKYYPGYRETIEKAGLSFLVTVERDDQLADLEEDNAPKMITGEDRLDAAAGYVLISAPSRYSVAQYINRTDLIRHAEKEAWGGGGREAAVYQADLYIARLRAYYADLWTHVYLGVEVSLPDMPTITLNEVYLGGLESWDSEGIEHAIKELIEEAASDVVDRITDHISKLQNALNRHLGGLE